MRKLERLIFIQKRLSTVAQCVKKRLSESGTFCCEYHHFVDKIVTDENVEVFYSVPRTLNENVFNTFGDKARLYINSRKQGLVLRSSTSSKDEVL